MKAVFLDRDGVLNVPKVIERKPYPPDTLAEFTLYPEAVPACQRLKVAGFLLILVTNQPDVGRGTQSREVVEAMHGVLTAYIPLDRIEVCYAPDSTAPDARRRKPAPGMVLDAAEALGIDLSQSFLVGDRWRDIDCGFAAGVRTIFIDRDYDESLRQKPDFTCTSLDAAVEIIL